MAYADEDAAGIVIANPRLLDDALANTRALNDTFPGTLATADFSDCWDSLGKMLFTMRAREIFNHSRPCWDRNVADTYEGNT